MSLRPPRFVAALGRVALLPARRGRAARRCRSAQRRCNATVAFLLCSAIPTPHAPVLSATSRAPLSSRVAAMHVVVPKSSGGSPVLVLEQIAQPVFIMSRSLTTAQLRRSSSARCYSPNCSTSVVISVIASFLCIAVKHFGRKSSRDGKRRIIIAYHFAVCPGTPHLVHPARHW